MRKSIISITDVMLLSFILVFPADVLSLNFLVITLGARYRIIPTSTQTSTSPEEFELYDLADANDTGVLFVFNKTDSLYLDTENLTYLSDFWTIYTRDVCSLIDTTISSVIDAHFVELGGEAANISAITIVWGYPDNFNTTIVVQESLTAPLQLFNYFVDVSLPQPEGFFIAYIGYYTTFKDVVNEANDAFICFKASSVAFPPEFDADTSHYFISESPFAWVPFVIKLIAVVGLALGIRGCIDAKKSNQKLNELEGRLDEMNKKLDEINKNLEELMKDKNLEDIDLKRLPNVGIEYNYKGTVDSETLTYKLHVPPVPEFPIGLALEILFIPVIIYMLWRNKQKKINRTKFRRYE